ncbi:hypothetical protein D3C73_1349640 [compost metagenome]
MNPAWNMLLATPSMGEGTPVESLSEEASLRSFSISARENWLLKSLSMIFWPFSSACLLPADPFFTSSRNLSAGTPDFTAMEKPSASATL